MRRNCRRTHSHRYNVRREILRQLNNLSIWNKQTTLTILIQIVNQVTYSVVGWYCQDLMMMTVTWRCTALRWLFPSSCVSSSLLHVEQYRWGNRITRSSKSPLLHRYARWRQGFQGRSGNSQRTCRVRRRLSSVCIHEWMVNSWINNSAALAKSIGTSALIIFTSSSNFMIFLIRAKGRSVVRNST